MAFIYIVHAWNLDASWDETKKYDDEDTAMIAAKKAELKYDRVRVTRRTINSK